VDKAVVDTLGHARSVALEPLPPLVRTFTDSLVDLGYMPSSIRLYRDTARHFTDWLRCSGISLFTIDETVVEQFMTDRQRFKDGRWGERFRIEYARRVEKFVRFLRDRGVVPLTAPEFEKLVPPLVTDFQAWLRRHRGSSEQTVAVYSRTIMRLLPALGDDPAVYDAGLIRGVILEKSKNRSGPYVKAMTAALRSYLRFLTAHGLCRSWLDHAVPTVAHWRLSALPRYLPASIVEKLIAGCNLTKPAGVRDRAILLLLARLGVRAGDIVAMRLSDIEWEAGALRVRGKGRREVRLPLPQEVGDAILVYLNQVRPDVDSELIFLRSFAPHGPFAGSASVTAVVTYALKRAGIANAPSKGAHLLRHSAATTMLRSGATLDTIGAVLRHRSVETTAHYAKVDVNALRQIAQAWPGDVSC
jgi:integrase/recombinase XerD